MIDEGSWAELEARTAPARGLVRQRVRGDTNRNLFLGVNHPARERLLIISVTPEAAQGLGELPNPVAAEA